VTWRSLIVPIVSFTPSGGNRVLCRFATEWNRQGRRVAFLVLDPSSRPTFDTTAELIYANSLDPALVPATTGKVNVLINAWRLGRALRRLRRSFDVALASHAFTAISCFLAGLRDTTIYYIQGYDPEVLTKKKTWSAYLGAALAYCSYWACRRQIVNSPHYIGYPAVAASQVVPPGVDVTVFHPKKAPPGLADGEIRIGIIGRSEPHKYRPAIEAFRKIVQRHPRCRLAVAYDNIPNDVLMTAGPHEIERPTNDHELAAFYRRCDVFLALSDFSTGAFYPPLEALACGTYLISNRFFLVNESNSWVVDSSEHILSAFEALLAEPQSERSARQSRGIADVASALDWGSLARRFAEITDAEIERTSRISPDVGRST
jgi:glycosyltransferase involved in cell wall biosynthesis